MYGQVSQVNPHVRLCLEPEEEFTGVQPTSQSPRSTLFRAALKFGRDEILYRAQVAEDLGLPAFLTRGFSLLNQQYTGDINILPEIDTFEFMKMMANPTADYMREAAVVGAKATWPKMCRIRNSVAIELALIKAINELRERVNFSPEARAARQAARGSNRGRSRSSRGRGPNFLRRRSLSNDYTGLTLKIGPPSPLPTRVIRRNASAGSLIEKLERLTWREPKELAPQAGIDGNALNLPSMERLGQTLQVPQVETQASTTLLISGFDDSLGSDRALEDGPHGEITDQETSSTSP
jgi:hypothetical protein